MEIAEASRGLPDPPGRRCRADGGRTPPPTRVRRQERRGCRDQLGLVVERDAHERREAAEGERSRRVLEQGRHVGPKLRRAGVAEVMRARRLPRIHIAGRLGDVGRIPRAIEVRLPAKVRQVVLGFGIEHRRKAPFGRIERPHGTPHDVRERALVDEIRKHPIDARVMRVPPEAVAARIQIDRPSSGPGQIPRHHIPQHHKPVSHERLLLFETESCRTVHRCFLVTRVCIMSRSDAGRVSEQMLQGRSTNRRLRQRRAFGGKASCLPWQPVGLAVGGPLEGRHSAFPSARQRSHLVADVKKSAPVGAQGRQDAFPPRART